MLVKGWDGVKGNTRASEVRLRTEGARLGPRVRGHWVDGIEVGLAERPQCLPAAEERG